MNSPKLTTSNNFFLELIKEKIREDESISIKVFKAFTVFGISSAWIFGGRTIQDKEHGLYGSASVVIWSYTVVFISLFCIMLLQYITEPNKNFDILKNISGIFTILLMIWIISINLNNFKKINMDLVPSSYFDYSNWTYLLLLVQSIFIFITIPSNSQNNRSKQDNGKIETRIKQISMLNAVLVFLTFVLVLIQQIILDNFSVDVL